jgi:hypothetical protein
MTRSAAPKLQERKKASFTRRDEWLTWITAQLATEDAQQLARRADVSTHTAIALADAIGNCGPSFAEEGIYARQKTIAARLAERAGRPKASTRLVRRGINLLVNIGALRIEPRCGDTNLLVPLLAGNRLYDTEAAPTLPSTPLDASVPSTLDASVPPHIMKRVFIQRVSIQRRFPPTPQRRGNEERKQKAVVRTEASRRSETKSHRPNNRRERARYYRPKMRLHFRVIGMHVVASAGPPVSPKQNGTSCRPKSSNAPVTIQLTPDAMRVSGCANVFSTSG